MTSRCLWHACRALVLGMVLMFVGGAMATVGYYANNFPSLSDVRSNSTSTIRVKNEHRGLHLNNLSYVGPIIMGVGGFIVVASCVMTFEARDSAAKVVPARFKLTGQSSARNPNNRNNTSRRSTVQIQTDRKPKPGKPQAENSELVASGADVTSLLARKTKAHSLANMSTGRKSCSSVKLGSSIANGGGSLFGKLLEVQQKGISNGPTSLVPGSQNARWEQHLGVFRTSPATEQVPDRKALTAALVHFSKALGTPKTSPHRRPSESQSRRVSRSGSVPNLYAEKLIVPPVASGSPANVRSETVGHRHHRGSRVSSMVQRSTRDACGSSGGLLHPGMLQFHRHALSVDEPEPFARTLKQAGSHGSVQYGYGGEIVPVHKLRDRNKRSDTARRHVLSRQTKIEKDESLGSPKHGHVSRRASTISNTSVSSKLNRSSRRASTVSKTPSVDSRGAASTVDINSLDRSLLTGLTPPRKGASSGTPGPISTPSVEKEYRSQLSICSEPAAISQRNLSCQSSLEPCVPEEESSPEQEHGPATEAEAERDQESGGRKWQPAAGSLEPLSVANPPLRPDSLVLEPDGDERGGAAPTRFLYRSNSSKSFRKPKPKVTSKKRSNEYDQIYVISSGNGGGSGGSIAGAPHDPAATGSGRYPHFQHAANFQGVRNADDDHYDSIEVIHERRSKNFSKFSTAAAGAAAAGPGQDEGQPDGGGGSVEGEYRKVGSNTISVVADISPVPPVAVITGAAGNDVPPDVSAAPQITDNGAPRQSTEEESAQNISPPQDAATNDDPERSGTSETPRNDTPCQ